MQEETAIRVQRDGVATRSKGRRFGLYDAGMFYVLQDWHANRDDVRIRMLLVLFRAAGLARCRFGRRNPVAVLVAAVYRFYALSLCSIDIPVRTAIGPRVVIHHGFGLVIHADAVLGSDVVLRHGVTIGNRGSGSAAPTIGNGVQIGVGATILGAISVGDNAKIPAHSLVLSDFRAT